MHTCIICYCIKPPLLSFAIMDWSALIIKCTIHVAYVGDRLTLGEREVALVSEGCVHQLGGIALVLVCVLELCIHHLHHTQPCGAVEDIRTCTKEVDVIKGCTGILSPPLGIVTTGRGL